MKRIILLLDGTWNDADIGPIDTNIVRMRDIISRSLDVRSNLIPAAGTAVAAAPEQKVVSGRTYQNGLEHLVFYERGVGTGPLWDRIKGGSFGEGLGGNIRRAYKFLSFYYQPGDQVFVFGFSRGAYTARSLVGYVAAAGLLRRDQCTPELEANAWHYYRTSPNDRLPGVWTQLTPAVHDRNILRISCLGVFDTVGALGVPLVAFYRINRERYEFHDVDLSSIVNVNLHAIAVDEHREPFQAAIWRKPQFKAFATVTEQVWFAGAHADIGGGYIEEERRSSDFVKTLDDITLDWMFKRLTTYFPDFPFNSACWKTVDKTWANSNGHEARDGFYRLLPYALRSIANGSVPLRSWGYESEVCRDRHAESIGEMIHMSVIDRLGKNISDNGVGRPYRPINLMPIFEELLKTYGSQTPPTFSSQTRIVNWDGSILDPAVGRAQETAHAALHEAKVRLTA